MRAGECIAVSASYCYITSNHKTLRGIGIVSHVSGAWPGVTRLPWAQLTALRQATGLAGLGRGSSVGGGGAGFTLGSSRGHGGRTRG